MPIKIKYRIGTDFGPASIANTMKSVAKAPNRKSHGSIYESSHVIFIQ